MARKAAKTPSRKPRSDAQRNRERILEVAKEAFTRSGANTSLDDVAKDAGVGAGTLYRHFPTRDMLLEAVYRTEQIIAPALNTLVGGPSKLYEGTRAHIQGAIEALVKRAIKSGDIRKDLEPFDLLRALIGVANVATSPDWQQSARRLVDILISGSRPF
jgi:AcrR family transcriptional regulator